MAGGCAAPQPDDGLVQGLLNSVDCNVQTLAETGYGALAQPYSPMAIALTAMLTLYIGFIGFRLLIGRTPLRVGDLTLTVLKIGAVLALATNWPTYQHLVFDTLFRGPEQLATGILTALGPSGSSLAGAPFAGLQAAYDELQLSATYFTQRSVGTVSPLQGGNAGAALALNFSALLMLWTSLGAVLAAKIVLGLLLGLGPVFVAFLLFDATRGLFEGWLRAAIAFALAPLMAVLGLVVQLILIEPHLLRLVEMRAGGLIDLAPANAIFATSLRLPHVAASTTSETLVGSAARSASVVAIDARAASQLQLEPRAAAVAAAAAAMERRDNLQGGVERPGSRRLVTGRTRDTVSSAPVPSAPAGQPHRRSAQPRSAASNLRRDR